MSIGWVIANVQNEANIGLAIFYSINLDYIRMLIPSNHFACLLLIHEKLILLCRKILFVRKLAIHEAINWQNFLSKMPLLPDLYEPLNS